MDEVSLVFGGMRASADALIGSPIVQTVIGGLIGAYAAGKAVDRQIEASRASEEKSDAAAIARLKLGLRVELEAVLKMTSQSLGPVIAEWKAEGARGVFPSVFPIESDYFTLFAKNADKLGQVEERAAAAVIHAYIELKGMVDSFRYNNRLLEESEQARLKMGAPGDNSWIKKHLVSIDHQLSNYGPSLIKNYDLALASVDLALKELANECGG
ncbi:UNVERIFIED_ORG: hypothetical protein M2420_000823 [Stenotrophomonas maltophilia]